MSIPNIEYRCFMIRSHAERLPADEVAAIIKGYGTTPNLHEVDLRAAEAKLKDALAAVQSALTKFDEARHELDRAA